MQDQESTYEKSDVVECVGLTNAFNAIIGELRDRGIGPTSESDQKTVIVLETTGRDDYGRLFVNARFFIGANMEDVSRELMPL